MSQSVRLTAPQHQLQNLPRSARAAQHVVFAQRTTALGSVLVAVCQERICWLGFADQGQAYLRERFAVAWGMAKCRMGDHPLLAEAVNTHPASFPLLVSGTPFQLEVWRALLCIPRGAVISYGDVARAIGRPAAARAVGNAVGANPVSWLIPCHRVGHSDGSLRGFGWGETCKRRLLTLEGAL